jgi:CRISPR/Cas system-associated protein Csm6
MLDNLLHKVKDALKKYWGIILVFAGAVVSFFFLTSRKNVVIDTSTLNPEHLEKLDNVTDKSKKLTSAAYEEAMVLAKESEERFAVSLQQIEEDREKRIEEVKLKELEDVSRILKDMVNR